AADHNGRRLRLDRAILRSGHRGRASRPRRHLVAWQDAGRECRTRPRTRLGFTHARCRQCIEAVGEVAEHRQIFVEQMAPLAVLPQRRRAPVVHSARMTATMANARECDVLVVGGGPAGSTIAALLAQKNKHVVVLEKEHFPRFHIGESLLPLNWPLFDRLGIADDVHRIGVYKPGAELVSDAHNASTTFRFADNPYLSVGYSYQVRRSDFDKLLLDNSRRLGAEVLEGVRVS